MDSARAIIVAYADNRVIGNRGKIPWLGQMPADMERVRELTRDQAIIMGLNTFRSIGRPLPNRQNIVLASDDVEIDDVDIAHSLDEAFALVESDRTPFIFGGASGYAQTLDQDLIDVMYATEIHGEFSGDTFFPEIPATKWREVERQDFPADAKNAFSYSFVKYERIR